MPPDPCVNPDSATRIREIYRLLATTWGPQNWWPARTRLEMIAGAYLTQNTAWANVELALTNLRRARALSLAGLRRMPLAELESLLRPAGYFRQKARNLREFVAFVDSRYGGSLDRMFAQPTHQIREELLALRGIGPETADSILLYAGNHPVFVVDAYTRRLAGRHGLIPEDAGYEDIRRQFEQSLAKTPRLQFASQFGAAAPLLGAAHSPSAVSRAKRTPLAQIYNEMHALLVGVGKHHCFKNNPECNTCPLRPFLE